MSYHTNCLFFPVEEQQRWNLSVGMKSCNVILINKISIQGPSIDPCYVDLLRVRCYHAIMLSWCCCRLFSHHSARRQHVLAPVSNCALMHSVLCILTSTLAVEWRMSFTLSLSSKGSTWMWCMPLDQSSCSCCYCSLHLGRRLSPFLLKSTLTALTVFGRSGCLIGQMIFPRDPGDRSVFVNTSTLVEWWDGNKAFPNLHNIIDSMWKYWFD